MTAAFAPDATGAFRRLDPRIIAIWRMATALRSLLWIPVVLVAMEIAPVTLPLALIAFAIAFIAASSMLFIAPARFRAWEFRVGNDDVRLRHGILWRTESVVPHLRIQHVDTTHGPLERWRGLASVIIYTAGSVGGALTIPGLALAEAEALRDHLAALSGSDDAV